MYVTRLGTQGTAKWGDQGTRRIAEYGAIVLADKLRKVHAPELGTTTNFQLVRARPKNIHRTQSRLLRIQYGEENSYDP
jgi:hypothetical protein